MVKEVLSEEQRDASINDSPVAPSMDADLKSSESRLEYLRVPDDELVGSMVYSQLSLYEKKSCVPLPSGHNGVPT